MNGFMESLCFNLGTQDLQRHMHFPLMFSDVGAWVLKVWMSRPLLLQTDHVLPQKIYETAALNHCSSTSKIVKIHWKLQKQDRTSEEYQTVNMTRSSFKTYEACVKSGGDGNKV